MSRSPHSNSLCIATDASLTGIGGVLHETRGNSRRSLTPLAAWAAPFPQRAEPKQMMTLEAIAVLVAITEWGGRLRKQTVWLQLDNQALVFAMQRGRSRCPTTNAVLQDIFTLLIKFQLQVCPFHVKSEDNGQADDLSRLWEPCPATSTLHPRGLTAASKQHLHTHDWLTKALTKRQQDIGYGSPAARGSHQGRSCTQHHSSSSHSAAICLNNRQWAAPAFKQH
jgi:hypothetical protein